MKAVKLFFVLLLSSITFTSCVVVTDEIIVDDYLYTENLVTDYDLWYVDYHRTTGTAEIPFLSKAFTVSFANGRLYANNNIVDIGITGNGLGIIVGNYTSFSDRIIEIDHVLDGTYSFQIVELSANEIRLDDLYNNVSYYLVGYQRGNFDYDMLFYDNIEYFLQEFEAWERTDIRDGVANAFDYEHFLQFTSENITTFYSSGDDFGTNIANLFWDYAGSYRIDDIIGYSDLKFLTLYYDGGDTEEFELSVINDETVELFHLNTQTTYVFSGRGFIQYLKGDSKDGETTVRNEGRKRTKVKREQVERKILK